MRAAGRYATGSGGGRVLLLELDGSTRTLVAPEQPPVAWRATG
ncbi:hypothetical protein PAI11_19420 [Patulibacter medicamentivorans]|uniref:Uncharacterized protein n=1 Tax=Patulibacter medicamentivorans TaxID=1097667 RepID=H0E555_9ACTN|nr:hypothetical protein PAI11_19420 [Patulibacter medicamentivorans]